jgi:competence protein ComEC
MQRRVSPLLLPALAFAAGAACALRLATAPAMPFPLAAAAGLAVLVTVALSHRLTRLAAAGAGIAASVAGLTLATQARDAAIHTTLRDALDSAFGGFALASLGPGGDHDPVPTRARLLEDAAPGDGFVSLRAEVLEIRLDAAWLPAAGGVTMSVGGRLSAADAGAWTAGRVIEAPVVFRRPARYLNAGVPDMERALALGGTTLFGSVKSGLLVTVRKRGNRVEEFAARLRRYTRRAIASTVGRHSELSAAIVIAVLIGDRSGLPEDVRLRLQAAGTYHVIAISGGNIAILAALVLGALRLPMGGRCAAAVTIAALCLYAAVVTSGPSVWRATTMAIVYLLARALDHRAGPWHAFAMAGVLMVIARPLDLGDAGFLLTFGATAALLAVARRTIDRQQGSGLRTWVAGAALASLATEIALLPIAASTFSRVTAAGLLLNFVAVPVMGIVQVAGLIAVAALSADPVAAAAAWAAHAGATVLVESSRLVDAAPWVTARVPPPGETLVVCYYGSLAGALWVARKTARLVAVAGVAGAGLLIVSGIPLGGAGGGAPPGTLRLTLFDVGQGEAMLLDLPDGSRTLIDTGGAPFGSGTFDIGGRVLAPALWARGVRSLGGLLITHGDPDHLGGARSVVADFEPGQVLEGIIVPGHLPSAEVREAAQESGASVALLRAGMTWRAGGARVRVLHPPDPDWERPRVRNDDSVVLEVVYGTVALLLTGDAGDAIEQAIVPQLTPSPVRILKAGHHGSRTSTSRQLLEAWRPQYALISAGRGNRFGHPTPDVIGRLESVGSRIYRTDRHGQITLTTDGRSVEVTTFTGGRR